MKSTANVCEQSENSQQRESDMQRIDELQQHKDQLEESVGNLSAQIKTLRLSQATHSDDVEDKNGLIVRLQRDIQTKDSRISELSGQVRQPHLMVYRNPNGVACICMLGRWADHSPRGLQSLEHRKSARSERSSRVAADNDVKKLQDRVKQLESDISIAHEEHKQTRNQLDDLHSNKIPEMQEQHKQKLDRECQRAHEEAAALQHEVSEAREATERAEIKQIESEQQHGTSWEQRLLGRPQTPPCLLHIGCDA